MLNFVNAILLGVVEGFTEFLPISSTAHLILAANFLHITQSNFTKSFEIAIQSGAILAVVLLYWRRFLSLEVIRRLLVAFIPTGILGWLFYKTVKSYLLGNTAVVLWSLAIGGVLLILFEKLFAKKLEATKLDLRSITYRQCFILGLCQALAMIPGISRAAATIMGGMFLGIPRRTIVEFSFLLAVPTMFAATGLDLLKSGGTFNGGEFGLLLTGFLTSLLLAAFSIRWLLSYLKKHDFTLFGVYRIALVLLFLL